MNIAIYLIRAILLITTGVIIANLVLESTVLRKFSPLIRPFCRATNLPRECVFSLFASFFNPTAGKSTLASFYREGKIGDKETIVTVIMCTFPIVIGESLFRVHAPVSLVLLGPYVGGIYIFITLFSAFIQTIVALIISRYYFTPHKEFKEEITIACNEIPPSQMMKTALEKSFIMLKKIIPVMIVAFLIIYLLFEFELMNAISVFFDPILGVLGLPGECITALIADLAHFTAGYTVVAALMTTGTITAKQAILTLLIGSMLLITLVYLKFSLSMYISLFGKLGVKITVISYLGSMLAKLFMIFLVVTVM
jgi:hypothetical protein